jgi:hypothetical protein
VCIPARLPDSDGGYDLVRSIRGWVFCLVLACLVLALPAWSDVSNLVLTVTDAGGGYYTYTWDVHYGADLSAPSDFGHFELEFPAALTTDSLTSNGTSPVGSDSVAPGTPGSVTVINTHNAAYFDLTDHSNWSEANVALECPDQDITENPGMVVSEVDFGNTGSDTTASDYIFSFDANVLFSTIHWEIQHNSETDTNNFEGDIPVPEPGGGGSGQSVPEPGTMALLLMGLPALGLLKRRGRK